MAGRLVFLTVMAIVLVLVAGPVWMLINVNAAWAQKNLGLLSFGILGYMAILSGLMIWGAWLSRGRSW